MALLVGCLPPGPGGLEDLINSNVPQNEDVGNPKDFGVIVTYTGASDAEFATNVGTKNLAFATELSKMIIGRFGTANYSGTCGSVGAICYHAENCGHTTGQHDDLAGLTGNNCNVYQRYSTVAHEADPYYIRLCGKAHDANGHLSPGNDPNPPYAPLPAPGQNHDTTFNSINEDTWAVVGLASAQALTVEAYMTLRIGQIIEQIAGSGNEVLYSGVLNEDVYKFADEIYKALIGNGKGGQFNRGTTKYTEGAVDGGGGRIYYNAPEDREWWIRPNGHDINPWNDANGNDRWDANDLRETGFKNYVGNIAELASMAMKSLVMINKVDYSQFDYDKIDESVFFKDSDGMSTGVYTPSALLNGPFRTYRDIKSVIVYNRTGGTIDLSGISATLNASAECDVAVYYRTVISGKPQMPFTLIMAEGDLDENGDAGPDSPTFRVPNIGGSTPSWFVKEDAPRMLAVPFTSDMGLRLKPFSATLTAGSFKYTRPIKTSATDTNNYGLSVNCISGGDYVEMIFQVVSSGSAPKLALYMGDPTVSKK